MKKIIIGMFVSVLLISTVAGFSLASGFKPSAQIDDIYCELSSIDIDIGWWDREITITGNLTMTNSGDWYSVVTWDGGRTVIPANTTKAYNINYTFGII